MKQTIRTLPLALIVAAGPVFAQDATTETPVPDPMELNMGVDPTAEDGPGSVYTHSEHNDWEVRCIRTEAGNDPCQLYQLLEDPNDNPVSEINVFPINDDAVEAAAGATVVTPLETLLTAQLAFQIDSAQPRQYPFAWCSQIGCFARLGFADADVEALKAGSEARIMIRPVAAPDQMVTLPVSLSGFTAAFDEASELNVNAEMDIE